MSLKLTPGQVEEIVAKAAAGATLAELAVQYGVDPGTIKYRLKKNGAGAFTKGTHKLTFEQVASLVAEYRDGVPVSDLARRYGIDRNNVYYHLRKVGVCSQPAKPTEEERAAVIGLRRADEPIKMIATTAGRTEGSVRRILTTVEITVSKEVASRNQRHWPLELDDRIVELRLAGKTRSEISSELGCPVSKVKDVLVSRGVTLPMEKRQENAYEGRLAINPDAMAEMREALTPEVIEVRSKAIAERYANDPELCKEQRQRALAMWANMSDDVRQKWIQDHSGQKSSQFLDMLTSAGVGSGEELLSQLATRHGGEVVGEYEGSKTLTTWRCAEGHEFRAIPNTVQQGHWCPTCAHVGPSAAQIEIWEYVKSFAPDALLSDRTAIKPLELDVYVPSKGVGVEYNGLLWHSSWASEYDRLRHQKKALACREKGVKLLAIFQDEWETKPDLVRAMIRWRLGAFSGEKLHARDLEIRRLDTNKQFSDFFERNHLDGHANASYAYGLYYGDKLVVCASVRQNFAGETELARLATDYDYTVRGAAARLIAAIRKEAPVLVSYSNNRLSYGDVYEKLEFQRVTESPPSYWYTDGRSARVWRFQCRRNNDPAIIAKFPTEKEQALGGVFSEKLFGDSRPLYQIHDYGHIKWRLGSAHATMPA